MGKDLNNKNSKVISFDYVMVRSSQHCGHDNVAFLKTVSFFLFTARPQIFWFSINPAANFQIFQIFWFSNNPAATVPALASALMDEQSDVMTSIPFESFSMALCTQRSDKLHRAKSICCENNIVCTKPYGSLSIIFKPFLTSNMSIDHPNTANN